MKIDALGNSGIFELHSEQKREKLESDEFIKKLESLKGKEDEKEIKEACEQFESVFINMLFKQMRKTIEDGGLVQKSHARETFEGMLDEEMSKAITKAGGIGLSDMMVKHFLDRYAKSGDDGKNTEDDAEDDSIGKKNIDIKG